jgi:hypothetical protein
MGEASETTVDEGETIDEEAVEQLDSIESTDTDPDSTDIRSQDESLLP